MDEGCSDWSLTPAWVIKQLNMGRGTNTHGLPEFVKVKGLWVSWIRCRFWDTEIWRGEGAVGEGEASIRAPQQTESGGGPPQRSQGCGRKWVGSWAEGEHMTPNKRTAVRDSQEWELSDELIIALNASQAQWAEFSSSLCSSTPKPCMSKRQASRIQGEGKWVKKQSMLPSQELGVHWQLSLREGSTRISEWSWKLWLLLQRSDVLMIKSTVSWDLKWPMDFLLHMGLDNPRFHSEVLQVYPE